MDYTKLANYIADKVLEKLEPRFKAIEDRLDKVEKRLDKVEKRLDKLENKVNKIENYIKNNSNAYEEQCINILQNHLKKKNDLIKVKRIYLKNVYKPDNKELTDLDGCIFFDKNFTKVPLQILKEKRNLAKDLNPSVRKKL